MIASKISITLKTVKI